MKKWKKFQLDHNIEINKDKLYLEACEVSDKCPNKKNLTEWTSKRGIVYSKRTTARKRIIQRIRTVTDNLANGVIIG